MQTYAQSLISISRNSLYWIWLDRAYLAVAILVDVFEQLAPELLGDAFVIVEHRLQLANGNRTAVILSELELPYRRC